MLRRCCAISQLWLGLDSLAPPRREGKDGGSGSERAGQLCWDTLFFSPRCIGNGLRLGGIS